MFLGRRKDRTARRHTVAVMREDQRFEIYHRGYNEIRATRSRPSFGPPSQGRPAARLHDDSRSNCPQIE